MSVDAYVCHGILHTLIKDKQIIMTDEVTQKEVTIYSTPTCHYCLLAKEFFDANDIAYTEHDVQGDEEKRNEMIERSGQMGVPVIFIGEEMVVGFEEAAIRGMLGM
jgi:glutaredoxin-like YruB-family protein